MEEKQNNILAILGLVFAFLMPIVGLIISIIALKKVKNGEYSADSKGMALAGLIISIVEIAVILLIVILTFTVFATATTGIMTGIQNMAALAIC